MKPFIRFILERPLLSLSAFFVASRLVLYHFFPFRMGFLSMLNQLFDINLLRTDLLYSLSQIHATPPLYNAFIGVILAGIPESAWPLAFNVVFGAFALGIVLLSYRILIFFRVSPWVALLGAFLMAVNPIMFRFEIIPFYTVPLAFLILLSVFALIRFVEKGQRSCLIMFLAIPLVVLLFRNFFHVIVFYVPILIGMCLLVYTTHKHLLRTAIIVSIVFLSIGLLPNIKNQIEYEVFSSSTWQGMQLFSMTYFVPEEKIENLVREGVVTPLALLPRFQNPEIYYEYYKETPRDGNPMLNALYKSTGAADANFNNWIYIQTAKEYGENTFTILARYPEYFIPRFVNSVYIFFGIANYRYFDKADEWLIFDGGLAKQVFQITKYFIQPAVLATIYLLITWFLIKNLWVSFREKRLSEGVSPIFLYSLFLLLYVFGVANVVELGENYTGRLPIDPLILIVLLLALSTTFSKTQGGLVRPLGLLK